MPDEILCPFCGEKIKAIAKKCKHCGEWLDETNGKSKTESVKRQYASRTIIALILLLVAITTITLVIVIQNVEQTAEKRPSESEITEKENPDSLRNQEELLFTDTRDGQSYQWIQIGNQVWMAENLNYQTNSGSWVYDHNDQYAETYGRLYNWKTAKNACPSGWHLPADEEWAVLEDYLGSHAGGKLKESGTAHWKSPNKGATNESGFFALPGGYSNYDDSFSNLGISGFWWSSSEDSHFYAWSRYIYSNSSGVGRFNYNKNNGLSVRCVRE